MVKNRKQIEKENKEKEMKKFKEQRKEAIKELFSKKWYRQIPNLLTASRLFSPAVILPLLISGNLPIAIGAEIGFALTDLFDGLIARKLNVQSEFGKNLDAMSDKFFAGSLLLPILVLQPVATINLGLEVLIGYINTKSFIKGNDTKSSIVGKIKTASLSTLIILTYASIFMNISLTTILAALGITTTLQGFAAMDYYMKDKKQDNDKDNGIETNKKEEIIEPTVTITNNSLEIDNTKKSNKEEIHYENRFPKEIDETKDKVLFKSL